MTQQQVETGKQPREAPFIAITEADVLHWYTVDMVENKGG